MTILAFLGQPVQFQNYVKRYQPKNAVQSLNVISEVHYPWPITLGHMCLFLFAWDLTIYLLKPQKILKPS